MNKLSSKLAAGVRKVKSQDEKPAATQAQAQSPKATKPAPAPLHPERVWPD